MAREVKPSNDERDPPPHTPPALLVLNYRSPPAPPVFRSPNAPRWWGSTRGTRGGCSAVFMSCLDRHGMVLTAWVVAMACVYVVIRTSGAKHLTGTRRVQVILAAFVSFVATIGMAVTYWGHAMRFDLHVPTPACRCWLALLVTAVGWFLLCAEKADRTLMAAAASDRWCPARRRR